MASDAAFMEKLVSLCRRRGFIFQSSEIYGGIGGFWDYGPLGVELKRNIKNAWWHDHVTCPPDGPDGKPVQMVGLDCSIIMNPKVWEASGHATGFADPMVDCRECRARYRADKAWTVAPFRFDAKKLWTVEVSAIVGNDLAGAEQLWGAVADSEAEAIELCRKQIERFEKKFKQSGNPIAHSAIEMADCNLEFMVCPSCQKAGTLTAPRAFNLMFKTFVGALEDGSAHAWLRPETAQGIFANFKNVLDTSRVKVPFGIAQIGKAFRNEINPRNFTFRSREFEQMEIEFFCSEQDSMQWWEFWRDQRVNWYKKLGLAGDKLRPRNQTSDELAHYSKACTDIEYLFPFSDEPQELEGVAHRGCFDLTQHAKHSGVDLNYFDEQSWSQFLADRKVRGEPELTKEQKSELGGKPPYRFLPTVIEPSAGADRATLAFLCEAYTEDTKPDSKGNPQTRVYLRFHPRLAPIKAAFLPLVNKEGMPELADKLYRDARRHMNVFFDDGGSIGRRYARMDEAGAPYCITIDGDTVKADGENAGMVTIRDRDTLAQERVHHSRVVEWLRAKIEQD